MARVTIGHKFNYLGKECKVTGFTAEKVTARTSDGHEINIDMPVFEQVTDGTS